MLSAGCLMFLIVFTAIIGGIGTAGALVSSHGWLIGVLSLPFAGSLWACLPIAFFAWNTRGTDNELLTDEMVVNLKRMADIEQRPRTRIPSTRSLDAA